MVNELITIDEIIRQVRGDKQCDACSDKLRRVCIREMSIQIKRTMDKEGWGLFDTERMFID